MRNLPLFASRFLNLFALLVFTSLLILFVPQPTQAQDDFSPTVRVVSYQHLLNGRVINRGWASGTIIDSKGQILTNAHAIIDSQLGQPFDGFIICVSESVYEPPNCRFTASIIRYDEDIDLALLQIDKNPILGTAPSEFPYLSYKNNPSVEESDPVSVQGFSANGGYTINFTQGQISGFSEINEFTYLKTDADIDAGNSGGAMLDAEGNFIGIPTYIVSYNANSGRALSINDAKQWIESSQGETVEKDIDAITKLRGAWTHLNDTRTSKIFEYDAYPNLSLKLPEEWEFIDVVHNGFSIYKPGNSFVELDLVIQYNNFYYENTTQEDLDLQKRFNPQGFTNDEIITLGEHEFAHFWKQEAGYSEHELHLNYGHAFVVINYSAPVVEIDQIKSEVESFLSKMQIEEPEKDNDQVFQVLNEARHPFTLEVPSHWRMILPQSYNSNLVAASRRQPLRFESLDVFYGEFPQGWKHLSSEQEMQQAIDSFLTNEDTLLFSNGELQLDGLGGWMLIYDTQLGDVPTKVVLASVLDPQYRFYFFYEAEPEIFDEGFKDLQWILNQFKSKRYDNPNPDWPNFESMVQGRYNIPVPNTDSAVQLSDIAGHRYEQNIRNLVDLGVINGNPDGTFAPEEPVNRAASLKIILQSLRAKQEANGEELFQMPADFNLFPDVEKGVWFETYVAEGYDKKIIQGHPDGTFKGDRTVNLAETLKMTLEAHDVTVWEGETDPWYKKYFDAANGLELLPNDLQDPAKPLTRAELAYVVDQLVSQ